MTAKRLLDDVLVNDIRNMLQDMYIEWHRFNYCQAYTTINKYNTRELVKVIIGNTDYYVQPIKSYNTVVGFAYCDQFYEVGKYSQTTSKQVTQIYNKYFSNYDRFYVSRIRW